MREPKPILAWSLVRAGEFIQDADGVIPTFVSRKVALDNAGIASGGSDGEEALRVRIVPAPKKARRR